MRGRGPRTQRGSRSMPWMPLIGAALVIAVLFATGFMLGVGLGLIPGGPSAAPDPLGPTPGGGHSTAPVAETPLVTSELTSLEFTITYSQCGCSARESRLAGVELAGLTAEQLAASYPEYAVQEFRADRVSLYRIDPGMCPEMTTYRTLGIRDGRVAVFFGRPGTGLIIQRLTTIEIEGLTAADRERLAAGIVLTGDASVERLLEGLTD